MKAFRDNLALILVALIAVVLVFLMVRLQSLIMTTAEPTPPASQNTPEVIQPQQPTVVVQPTVIVPATPEPSPTALGGVYQNYGAMIVGAIHVGSINDRGYNQANDEGLQQMLEQLPGVRLISAENVPETEAVLPVIDDMVARGAQIIFTQSFGYLPYALQAGERYPNVTFVNSGGFELRENVGTYLANHVEMMYLTGMAAGATTKTGQVGMIIGFPMPSSLASVNAFHLGARAANPTVTTHVVTTGAWVDPVAEKQGTEALATIGVDVVAMIVDSPTTIVQTAAERGMYVIGFHSDSLQELAPDHWLTGVQHTWGNYFTKVVQQVRAGQWRSSNIRGGVESDMLRLAPFGPAVSAEARASILAARTDIIGGRFRIFTGPLADNQGIERIPAGQVGQPELLDNTDWLVEGVSELDPATIAIAPAQPAASQDATVSTASPAAPTATQAGYTVYGAEVIGAIHVGAINDRGYNQAHHDGLQQMIEQVPGVRLIEAENIPETEAVLPVIDSMVQQGAKIIFVQSFGYLPFALQAAERYPAVTFLHPGGFELRDNLGTYWANNFEAMYLAGIVAGGSTKTNQLGFITAFPIPNILASVNAFHLGARSVNPNVITKLVINESWVDPAKEELATRALAASGVDVVTMIVDSPITIVQTAEALGIYVIGFHSDALQELAPNGWLTGVAYTWGNYYTQAVQQIRAGQWRASHIRGGIESDMLRLATFGPAVREELKNQIIGARTDIVRGQLPIFQGPLVDNSGVEQIAAGQIGGLELLDTTDWLITGIENFDVASVPADALPAVAVDSAPPIPAASGGAAESSAEPLATVAPAPSVQPTPVADLVFGVIQENETCLFFTDVVKRMVEGKLGVSVAVADYAEAAGMYAALATRQDQRTVDLTLCFVDPQDRPFLREHFGFIRNIGDIYWRNDEMRLQIVSNSGLLAELEQEQVCVYRLLKNLNFEGSGLPTQEPAQWVDANADLVDQWASCELLP
ncbi:MAG: BMP family ABC transporter substrate-binding protein [Caldilineaceae bacterium]